MNRCTATAAFPRALVVVHRHASTRDAVVRTASRSFATGPRGARGLGWYVNYRAGKGGRHLQGRYHDRESLESCQQWNDAILQLGSTQVYMDVVLEPKQYPPGHVEAPPTVRVNPATGKKKKIKTRGAAYIPPLDQLTGERSRLVMDVASAVMPETVDNFVRLLNLKGENEYGYKGTKLYRFEKDVGVCGGDVLTNQGKSGLAAPYEYTAEERAHPLLESMEPLRRTLFHDPLVMWHLPGTVTMFVHRVHEVDSRFLLCSQRAMHLDGIQRAFGQLRPESLEKLRHWHTTLLTKDAGIPMSYDLIVADCGVLENDDDRNIEDGRDKEAEAA